MESVSLYLYVQTEGASGAETLTCSAKKDMTVKTMSVTRTQWVQNFSLSRYTRLGGRIYQLVLNRELLFVAPQCTDRYTCRNKTT